MKVSASAIFALALSPAAAAAFTLPSSSQQSRTVFRSAPVATVEEVEITNLPKPAVASITESAVEEKPAPVAEKVVADPALDIKNRIQVGRYDEGCSSLAIPFLKRPTKLDGSHAGDYGFDPLGLSETYDVYTMQESEIRHGRLAMLAVIGWPMSELLAPDWMLQKGGCAPSVLNGFNPLTFLATAAIFGGLGYFEYKTSLRRVNNTPMGKKHSEDMANVWDMGVAGDYNWDPMGLYSSLGDDPVARKGLRDVEISHGRSAMLGITGFAGWEFLTGHAIVENSMFFHPNLLLPALATAYVAATQVYEFEESDQYLKLKVSSEGEARLENAKISLARTQEKNKALIAASAVAATKAFDALQKGYEIAKDSYEQANEEYVNYAMKNYNETSTM